MEQSEPQEGPLEAEPLAFLEPLEVAAVESRLAVGLVVEHNRQLLVQMGIDVS